MDVIAIHNALTKIWPGGIRQESYPVLAALVKVLLEEGKALSGPATLPTGVPSTESLLELDGPQNGERRPGRPLTPKIQAARGGPDATAMLGGKLHAVQHKTAAPRFLDPSGRVSSATLKRVYDEVLPWKRSGISVVMVERRLNLSYWTVHRALGVLAKRGLLIGTHPHRNQNLPRVYRAAP